jgi:hypothetical protein
MNIAFKYLAGLTLLCAVQQSTQAATYVIGSDARPNVVGGRIITDAYDDVTAAFATNVKHFGYQLGKSPNNPYFTSDPGFNAILGSGLPQGDQLRFEIVRRLVRWDGSAGLVRFVAPPNDESLRLSFGSAEAIVTGTTDSVTGFSLGNIASGGAIHKHLNATFRSGADALSAPSNGLYFTAIRLNVSSGSVTRSDALYIAYNLGLPADVFARGMSYLANPLGGDANFDSAVDFNDLVILAQHYGNTGEASYFDGDFNGDRAVDFDDLVILAQHYNLTAASSAARANIAADWALAKSLVPEPLGGAVIGGMLFLTAMRRRQR